MIYFIIFFTILFFILSWRRLDLAVMFLITALPTYLIRFSIFGLPSTLLEVMIWGVFLAWLLKNYGQIIGNLKLKIGHLVKINNRYPFDWEIILWLIVAFIAAGVSGFSSGSLGIWKAYFFEPVLLFIVVINLMMKQEPAGDNLSRPSLLKRAELVLWPFAISAFLVSLLAIYQKFTGTFIDNPLWAAETTRRVVSVFGYPNAVGLYLGPIVLVLLGWLASVILEGAPATDRISMRSYLSFRARNASLARRAGQSLQDDKLGKYFIGLTIVLSLLSIYFAKSKGALLGVATGLIVFGLLAGRKIRLTTIILIIIFGASVMAYQPTRDLAIKNITLTNLSGQIRKAGWSDTWKMLKDGRLITGAGLANYQAIIKPYHTEGMFIKDPKDPDAQRKLVFNQAYRTAHWQPLEIYLYPHNIVLNFWSELGLVGLLIFIFIIGKYFFMGIINMKKVAGEYKFLNIGLICAIAAIIVHGIVDVPYFKNDLAVMFWLLIALVSQINLETFNSFFKKSF